MFFKRRLRDERRAPMIVFRRAFHFFFLVLRVGHKRDFPLFLGLSFLFTTVFFSDHILALTYWRVLLLCTSRSLFNSIDLQWTSNISFICTWSRDILVFISWIYNLRDFGSRQSTTESCDRYVHGFFLLFLDLPSFVIDFWHLVCEVDILLSPSALVMSVEGSLGTIASI